MARTGTTIWIVLGIGAAVLLVVALIYGPDLYRKGESIVAPIMELSKAEEEISDLDAEMPFTPPGNGVVEEDRLLLFFEIRRELVPHYENYQVVENRIERNQQDDFQAAGEVLAVITVVYDAQLDLLRSHGMSPAEFRWLEFTVYDGWLDKVTQGELSEAALAYTSEIRQITSSDIEFVDRLHRSHGSSAALSALRERLADRLLQLDQPETPAVEDVPPQNSKLFWRHREAIAELQFDEFSSMHTRLRHGTSSGVNINLNSSHDSDDSGDTGGNG